MQFLWGLMAGIIVGLVMEWVVDWAGLMPRRSRRDDNRQPARAAKKDAQPETRSEPPTGKD